MFHSNDPPGLNLELGRVKEETTREEKFDDSAADEDRTNQSNARNSDTREFVPAKDHKEKADRDLTSILSAFGSINQKLDNLSMAVSRIPVLVSENEKLKHQVESLSNRLTVLELMVPNLPPPPTKDLSILDTTFDEVSEYSIEAHSSRSTPFGGGRDIPRGVLQQFTHDTENLKVYTTRYEIFGAIIVGILESLQDRVEALSGDSYNFSSSAVGSYGKIVKLCSFVEQNSDFKLPGVSDPATVDLLKVLGRKEKRGIMPISASTLRSMKESSTLKNFYRSLIRLWIEFRKYQIVLEAPVCDILRFTSDNIIKECEYDSNDNTMLESFPAVYDCQIKKIELKVLSDEQVNLKSMKVGDMVKYLTRVYPDGINKKVRKRVVAKKSASKGFSLDFSD
jgi:hypothetical protein